MAYTHISAAGALPGQVSPAEQMAMANAQRRMAMQGGGGFGQAIGGGGPEDLFNQLRGESMAEQQQQRLFSGQEGYDKRMLKRQTRRDMELGLMEGAQERDVTQMKMAPSQQYADLARQEYEEGKDLRDFMGQTKMGLLRQLLPGAGAGAAVQGGMTPEEIAAKQSMQQAGFGGQATAAPGGMDQLEQQMIALAIINGGAPPDIIGQRQQREMGQLQLADYKRERDRRMAEQDARAALSRGDQATAQRLAEQANVQLTPGSIEGYVGENEALTSQLGNLAKSYYDRDVADLSSDPTEFEIGGIIEERNRLVKVLTDKGYDPQDALREANRVVRLNLGGERGDWEAEMTQLLMQRMGL